MRKYWTIGIMAALGMILGRMFLPSLGKYIENQAINQITDVEVIKYINNSKQLNFRFNKYEYNQSYYRGNFLSKASLEPYQIRTNYTFYDTVLQKYFSIQMFDFSNISAFDELLEIANGVNITAIVNNEELQNNNYGTADNPIPIFKCFIPDNISWHKYSQSRAAIIKRNNEHYRKSIFYHLTYYTPKEEFQKMFPEQK
jgi:hypothetical protein